MRTIADLTPAEKLEYEEMLANRNAFYNKGNYIMAEKVNQNMTVFMRKPVTIEISNDVDLAAVSKNLKIHLAAVTMLTEMRYQPSELEFVKVAVLIESFKLQAENTL